MANVTVRNEVFHEHRGTGWRLCYQRVLYDYGDGYTETGYRYIWRRPPNAVGKRTLQGARGQARLPSAWIQRKLLAEADAAGWGRHDADIEDQLLDQSIKADSELANS